MMDPPGHDALRRLVIAPFTHQRVQVLDATIRAFVVERLERLRATGGGDVVAELLKPLPSLVVAHFLGVPPEDRGLFDRWTAAIVAANAAGNVFHAAEAVAEMAAYFGMLAERRRLEPGEDMISTLVQGDVSFAALVGVGFTMVTGGNDTTTGLLGGALELLTHHPEQRAILLGDPAGRIRGAVEEFLRLTTPVQGLARTTTRAVEIAGRTIPPDGRSCSSTPRPTATSASSATTRRPATSRASIRRQLAFSPGPHHCIGAAAARLQAKIVLEELLARCPRFVVDAGAGRFAPGAFVRRYESLPFRAGGQRVTPAATVRRPAAGADRPEAILLGASNRDAVGRGGEREQVIMAHVLIVGAGPAGAGLAHLLAHRGIQVTLLERQSDFAASSAARCSTRVVSRRSSRWVWESRSPRCRATPSARSRST